jgi:hypothetical protein
MLPFLKERKIASVLVAKRSPEGEETTMPEVDEGLMAAAEDLIRAVHSKDAHAVASALKAAFEISDSQPHEEGPHE